MWPEYSIGSTELFNWLTVCSANGCSGALEALSLHPAPEVLHGSQNVYIQE